MEGEDGSQGDGSHYIFCSVIPTPQQSTLAPAPSPPPALSPTPRRTRGPLIALEREERSGEPIVDAWPGLARGGGRGVVFLVDPPPPRLPTQSSLLSPPLPCSPAHAAKPWRPTLNRLPGHDRPTNRQGWPGRQARERARAPGLSKNRLPPGQNFTGRHPVLPAPPPRPGQGQPLALCQPTWRPWRQQGEKHRFFVPHPFSSRPFFPVPPTMKLAAFALAALVAVGLAQVSPPKRRGRVREPRRGPPVARAAFQWGFFFLLAPRAPRSVVPPRRRCARMVAFPSR